MYIAYRHKVKVNLFVSEDKYGRKATIVPRSAGFSSLCHFRFEENCFFGYIVVLAGKKILLNIYRGYYII